MPLQGMTTLNLLMMRSFNVPRALPNFKKLNRLHLTRLPWTEDVYNDGVAISSCHLPFLTHRSFGSYAFDAKFCLSLLPQLKVLRLPDSSAEESFLLQLSEGCLLEELDATISTAHWPTMRSQLLTMPALQKVSLRIYGNKLELVGIERIRALKALELDGILDSSSVWELGWLEKLGGVEFGNDIQPVERVCSCFPHLKQLAIHLSPAILQPALSILMPRLNLVSLSVNCSMLESEITSPVLFLVRHEVTSLERLDICMAEHHSLVPFLAYQYPNVTYMRLSLPGFFIPRYAYSIWETVPHLESLHYAGSCDDGLLGISKCTSLREAFVSCKLFSHAVMELIGSKLPLEVLILEVTALT